MTPSQILKVILIQNTSKIAYSIEDRSSYLDQFELCIKDMNNSILEKYNNFSRKLPELPQIHHITSKKSLTIK